VTFCDLLKCLGAGVCAGRKQDNLVGVDTSRCAAGCDVGVLDHRIDHNVGHELEILNGVSGFIDLGVCDVLVVNLSEIHRQSVDVPEDVRVADEVFR